MFVDILSIEIINIYHFSYNYQMKTKLKFYKNFMFHFLVLWLLPEMRTLPID